MNIGWRHGVFVDRRAVRCVHFELLLTSPGGRQVMNHRIVCCPAFDSFERRILFSHNHMVEKLMAGRQRYGLRVASC